MSKGRYNEIGKIKDVNKNAIKKATELIKNGKIFDLGMEINENISVEKEDSFHFKMLFESTPEDIKKSLRKIENNSRISASNEVVMGSIHSSTHIDALCHMHLDDKVIEKFNINDSRTSKGWEKCGSETIPPIIGRGILLDIAKYLNKEKLEDNYIISLDEVKSYLKDKNISIRFGDIVCVRTGKIKDFYKKDYRKSGPGIGPEASEWLCSQGMCVLCLDYFNVDGNPLRDYNNCTHIQMLYRNKVYLIEDIYLEELSKESVLDFFIICSSIKFTGTSGSWVRPIAII